jgi:hypothetical protein
LQQAKKKTYFHYGLTETKIKLLVAKENNQSARYGLLLAITMSSLTYDNVLKKTP